MGLWCWLQRAAVKAERSCAVSQHQFIRLCWSTLIQANISQPSDYLLTRDTAAINWNQILEVPILTLLCDILFYFWHALPKTDFSWSSFQVTQSLLPKLVKTEYFLPLVNQYPCHWLQYKSTSYSSKVCSFNKTTHFISSEHPFIHCHLLIYISV